MGAKTGIQIIGWDNSAYGRMRRIAEQAGHLEEFEEWAKENKALLDEREALEIE